MGAEATAHPGKDRPTPIRSTAAHTRGLYGARALADWVRSGGRPQRPTTAHAARLWWHALWFEHNWRTQATRLGTLVLPEDPVFILGLWRSGTTALHELLAACTQWATARTWQCFNPSTCFLAGAPAARSAERPMDAGRIATDSPQEDEFALLLLGEPSVYRAFIDPRRLQECGAQQWGAGDGPAASTLAAALPRWQSFVRGIAADSPGRRLLLKSPNHSFRVPLLRTGFPRARFIWIGRHVGEILQSNLKMWRAMMAMYALWPCPTGALEQFLREVLQAGAEVLERCVDEMPREQLLWLDFEQLHADPRRALERVLEFIGPVPGLEPAQLKARLDQAIAQITVHAGTRAALPDDDRVQRLENVMAAARTRFGGSRQSTLTT
ncbi:MAG: sulfotransferase family protein [Steroidobacteraceae bacterium]